ncbi:hypothetical protein [Paraburkholderia sp. ZP32-5]|uniref:hypothetical protein n=1 Tax=Paraburkholderia sp. ZP32-5 TaxID=2883245 RepID=UPI001F33051B|nr:hypothetical protein [Paraburkholderia sp. ZP32-5]
MQMKEYKRQMVNRHAALFAASAFLLSACGGGGSSSGSGSAAATANLSDAQKNYESFALASNGGLHFLESSFTFTTLSTNTVSIGTDSRFFSEDSSIPQSPANGTQTLTETLTSLSSTLKAPASVQDRFVINGAIYGGGIPGQAQVSYTGPNVQIDYLATDGKTVVRTVLGTSYSVVQLSGLISASPSELFTNSAIGALTNTLNGQPLYNKQANWESGSAYVKVVRHVVGDELFTYDCTAPATTSNNPTPCSATISTLESLFPYASTTDNKTYQLTDGQIVTLAGVRAWVSNTPLNGPTTDYRVYFQYNGGIYAGYVIKDGTTLQIAPLGGGTPQDNYYVLNNAAVQSIKSAINF